MRIIKYCENCGTTMKMEACPDVTRRWRCQNPYCANPYGIKALHKNKPPYWRPK